MSKKSVLLFSVIVLTLFNLMSAISSELSWTVHSQASNTLVQTTGFIGIALSSECTATRNPILESVCACLGDLPGGYCYHLSCGIVGIPVMVDQPSQIETSSQPPR